MVSGEMKASPCHLIHEIVNRGDVAVSQIASEDNLADPFTKG